MNGFSDKSRARLRHVAENSALPLISQFSLTYHHEFPDYGRTCKAHLNAFLTFLRRIIPGIGNLWLAEFQRRNAPHFHLFLTIPPSDC